MPKNRTNGQDKSEEWPHEWCAPFLEALRTTGNVKRAAEEAEIARSRCYELRHAHKAFREAWETAEEAAVNLVLTPEAIRRAVQGTEKGVYYQGKKVGVEREYSDTLLIFLLKSHAPARYNQPVKQEHSGTAPIMVDLTAPPEGIDGLASLGDGI